MKMRLARSTPGRAKMPYDGIEASMSKRELITRELDRMPEQDLVERFHNNIAIQWIVV